MATCNAVFFDLRFDEVERSKASAELIQDPAVKFARTGNAYAYADQNADS